YASPQGRVQSQLLPDTVTPMVASNAGWYKTSDGYVRREALQPIHPYRYPAVMDSPGFWAEFVAPAGSVRQWCGSSAPIMTSLNYGAVVYVMDRLVDDRQQVWYGLSDVPGSRLI